MKAEELDKKFDDGEDVLDLFDLSTLKRPALETQSVSVNLPQWMIAALDRESVRLDVERQSIIKFWLAERLERVTVNS
jgi:hypothetical protein